jgi:signal transduction histidine kinase
MSFSRKYGWIAMLCGLLLLVAGWLSTRPFFLKSKIERAQRMIDVEFQFATNSIRNSLDDIRTGAELRRHGVFYYIMKGDSMAYWNENNLDISSWPLISGQKFIDLDGVKYLKCSLHKNDGVHVFTFRLPVNAHRDADYSNAILYSPDRSTSVAVFLDHSYPPLVQWICLCIYLFGIVYAFKAIQAWSVSFLPDHQIITSLLLFVSGIFLVRVLSLYFKSFFDFPSITFFDDIIKPSLLSPSLGDLMINVGMVCFLVWFVKSYIRPHYFNRAFSKNWGIGVFNYWLVYLSALVMIYIFRQLVMNSGLLFDFEYIFYLDAKSLVALAGILILAIALFILDLHLLRIIRHLGLTSSQRLLSNILALGALIPVVYLLPVKVPILLILGLGGYLTLLDLFIDHFKPHAAWYIVWTITGSILISSLLYQFHMDKEWAQRKMLAGDLKAAVKYIPEPVRASVLNQTLNKKETTSDYLSLYELKYVSESKGFNALPTTPGNNFHWYQDPSHHTLYTSIDGRTGFYLSKKSNQLFKVFSFFSYVFIFFNLILLGFSLLNRYFKWISFSIFRFFPSRQTLRFRIQISMLTMSVCSFILIAVVIIFYIKGNAGIWQLESPPVNTHDLSQVKELLQPNGNIHDAYKIFDAQGNLISNPNERMPYTIWSGLHSNEFQLNRIYNIVTWNGKKYFIQRNIQLQSLQFKRRLNDFLGALLNVYVFLLILIVFLSMVVANSIARPLRILSSKLKQIQIGGSNQRLEWNHQDELGGLIRNYNEMIQELDRSTRLLALTERETAWREMAKQVAHEIKNPLTPMKLITQHLQNSIQRAGQDEIQPLVTRVTQTLIEQIDNLSKIASEFSNFAKLPAPENEKLIMNEVVTSTHDLFRKREDMDIHLRVPIDEIYVFADKNHIIRVLTNLIKNAIQAIPLGRRGRIEIILFKNNERAVVKVTDNGCGIPDSMKDKVFYPNFTTKNSGTGLGLAIVRDIIDSCNGNIYFHTAENKGTEFYIELPLMHVADNFKEERRVSL